MKTYLKDDLDEEQIEYDKSRLQRFLKISTKLNKFLDDLNYESVAFDPSFQINSKVGNSSFNIPYSVAEKISKLVP